ncbi:adenylate/guanylate cyclase domain-containing protein [Blastococcus tunisiensis]|uniref:adenylate/guanylate cyclase domain-containing protein n=1 Tax=Blastococcus tunisiensis TaxID=1798228 RepID=UPI0020C8A9DB|nr:adenylate/guanylate cyclase domain-containing protein [Blastococcus sp. DSM 46838]
MDARAALEQLLLDGPRRYTRLQVAALAGMAPERTQRLWRALGFPDAADDDPAFTDADVAVLGVLSTLIDSGFVGPETEASIARAMGQSLSRLADWQTDMLADALFRAGAHGDRPDATAAEAVEAARTLLPRLREVQDYVWRRHLAANADRLLTVTAPGDRRQLAVGFADLVGYTSRTRGMGGRELGVMVEDFESIAAEVIARHHGRVVKTVGDGVLFTAGSALDAVEIGLQLPVAWAADDRPPLRVGAAYGAVLTRLGDVYSPVVNLASRLTSLARPGTMLVDRDLADHVRQHPAYRVRPLRRVSVRGYDHLQPWLVRRRPAGDAAATPDGGDEHTHDEHGYDEEAFAEDDGRDDGETV